MIPQNGLVGTIMCNGQAWNTWLVFQNEENSTAVMWHLRFRDPNNWNKVTQSLWGRGDLFHLHSRISSGSCKTKRRDRTRKQSTKIIQEKGTVNLAGNYFRSFFLLPSTCLEGSSGFLASEETLYFRKNAYQKLGQTQLYGWKARLLGGETYRSQTEGTCAHASKQIGGPRQSSSPPPCKGTVG